jgi:hypothetical protein
MDKEYILSEIRRTAEANGGKPLGRERFTNDTGINYYDWFPIHWVRWSDAVREAGLEPNRMAEAYEDEYLLEKLVLLTRQLNHVPVQGELIRASAEDSTFPSEKSFRRLGSKADRVSRVIAFCQSREGFEDVADLWKQAVVKQKSVDPEKVNSGQPLMGYVYLIKHGARKEYKIGRTNNMLRREGEIGIELPERAKPVHVITTDDPAGIEAYWHNRFNDKRLNGEWFNLSADDIRAFKRRKFM